LQAREYYARYLCILLHANRQQGQHKEQGRGETSAHDSRLRSVDETVEANREGGAAKPRRQAHG